VAYLAGEHPGTIWHKTDMQCHSPRDRGWTDGPDLSVHQPSDDEKRKIWATEFISACKARRISVAAITDHHDITMIPYVQEAAQKAGSLVLIFPGVEITCSDNAQVLAIFDPSTPPATLTRLLDKLRGVPIAPPSSGKTHETIVANLTVEELCGEVEKDSQLSSHCLLLPHFSDGEAHKSLNEDGHHQRFANIKCYGVYIEKAFSDLEAVTVQKVRGQITQWGSQRRALVATGDNKRSNFDRLGKHECWLKLGEPTLEAMRQAFLADESRVRYESPVHPPEIIIELRVQSKLTGDFILKLNDGFNAIIGGRGSGKSAILEYLRFGLGRTQRDLATKEEIANLERTSRDAQLIEETLSGGGYVQVTLEREGVKETWRRTWGQRDKFEIVHADGTKIQITLAEAQRRFRARAFYQKGLSSTMNDSTTAAEQITGIAAAEQVDRRRQIDLEIEKSKRELSSALRGLVSLWRIKSEHSMLVERANDIRQRLKSIADRLEEEGVSKEYLDIIEQAPAYDRAITYQGLVNRNQTIDKKRLSDIKSNILQVQLSSYPEIQKFPELVKLDAAVSIARAAIERKLNEAVENLDALGVTYIDTLAEFEIRHAEFKTTYAAATAQQDAHKSLLQDNSRLQAELQEAEAKAAEVALLEVEALPAEAVFRNARQNLSKLVNERRAVLAEAAEQVAEKTGRLLKARVKRDPTPSDYISALSRLFDAARITDMAAKTADWVNAVAAVRDRDLWGELGDVLLRVYEQKVSAGNPTEPSAEISATIQSNVFGDHVLTQNQINRIYLNIDDERVAMVLASVPRDFIQMTYIDQGSEFAFERASPGQQASALLELLLKQSAGPLIIDQPEDDLDNRIIMKVVALIRESKSARQLVFATHNSNIVVNGDADKVIALASGEPQQHAEQGPRVRIDTDGAIETDSVRSVVTRIMEGGKEAFDLRSRKYKF